MVSIAKKKGHDGITKPQNVPSVIEGSLTLSPLGWWLLALLIIALLFLTAKHFVVTKDFHEAKKRTNDKEKEVTNRS